jgi:two-component system chemotaxis response regulator CheB
MVRKAAKPLSAAGGNVIAQDEATSVVWGMPGAVANAGICAAVLPLDQIASKVVRVFSGVRA